MAQNPLVSTQWLEDHLDDPAIFILDASYYIPIEGKNALDDYETVHIPNAHFFPLDDIAQPDTPLPHMVPTAEAFGSFMTGCGLNQGQHVVIYDRRLGGAASARVWWMFRYFGYESVSVLDGSFAKWAVESRPTTADIPAQTPAVTPVSFNANPALIRNKASMLSLVKTRAEQILDARSADRFAGEGKEPWPVHKIGKIPSSFNLPWDQLINQETKEFKTSEEITALFKQAGIDLDAPLVTSCGSGVTAAALALGAYIAGKTDCAVYDGSWAEWGSAPDTPVA